MLTVRASLSPDDLSGLVRDPATVFGDEFTVRFHRALLEVVGESGQVLIVRQQSVSLSAVEVVVPDAEQREDDGQIVFEFGVLEMKVHLMSANEQLLEVIVADVERNGKPDRRPKRVATADPVEEREHVLLSDAEGLDSLGVRR